MDNPDLFHEVVTLPEPNRAARYRRLVGLDDKKALLRKEAAVLADPRTLLTWASQHHVGLSENDPSFTLLRDRAPLLLFAGDVGSGKSALAESFGCDLADTLGVSVNLFRLKLTTRGEGHVGEMTALIGQAFEQVAGEARLGRTPDGRLRSVTILVIDEADALVQSREASQMHHEDRAGVDALLQQVDDLAGGSLPILVVMCTNRLEALDPAIRRRAAAILTFTRPDHQMRRKVLGDALAGYGLRSDALDKVAEVTGSQGTTRPGFTFSDLTQRLVPRTILAAYPDRPVTGDLLLATAQDMNPTPEFKDVAAR